MPVESCQADGKPGFRWGERGHCYTYEPNDEAGRERARSLAERQGRAIQAQGAAMSTGSQRKSLTVEIKDADKGLIEAAFSSFNVVDHDRDWTLPEAFESGAKVRISAYGHGSWQGALPVGRGMIRAEREHAVLDGKFFLSTTPGRETFNTVKEMGDLQEWSYGYDVLEEGTLTDEHKAAGAIRVLKKLKVHEVSPVLVGAGVGTRTLSVKGLGEAISLSAIEKLCPPCAEKMRAQGITGIKWAWILNRKQMPAQMLEGLCASLGGDPGLFGACMDKDFGEFSPGDKEAFCAWLHHECTGIWPAEDSESSREAAIKELARFELTRARLLGIGA